MLTVNKLSEHLVERLAGNIETRLISFEKGGWKLKANRGQGIDKTTISDLRHSLYG